MKSAIGYSQADAYNDEPIAQQSYLNRPLSCAVDSAGDLLFADNNFRLRTGASAAEKHPHFEDKLGQTEWCFEVLLFLHLINSTQSIYLQAREQEDYELGYKLQRGWRLLHPAGAGL